MPTDAGHAIADLASLAGVTPRTIRYYVSVGLIPPPDQVGRGARYRDDHLHRIRLIRRLQDQHLPLAEIRARLGALTDDEVAGALSDPDPEPPDTALDYIRSLTSGSRSRALPPPPQALMEPPAAPSLTGSAHGPAPAPSTSRSVAAMWERIPLTADVELHVRRPLSRTANRRVERLVTIAREILEDQP